jgi:hypothetical protein
MALAERLEDRPTQLLLLHWIWQCQIRSADYRGALETNGRFKAVAAEIGDPLAEAIAHGVASGTSLFTGDRREVLVHAQRALDVRVDSSILSAASFCYHNTIGARNASTHCLWMLGYPDQSLRCARENLKEALDRAEPMTIAIVINQAGMLYVWTGEWLSAVEMFDRLASHAAKYRLSTYSKIAVGWQGCLAVLRGDLSPGIECLRTTLADLRADGNQMWSPQLASVLARGLASAGQHELGYAIASEWCDWSESSGSSWDVMEIQRVKGEILISMSPARGAEGEACLLDSLRLAEQQFALSLALRSGMSLARFWADQQMADKALELLSSVYNRFKEGFGTRDLITAAELLAGLRSRS